MNEPEDLVPKGRTVQVAITDGVKASAPTPRVVVTHGPEWFAGGFRHAYARFQRVDATSPVSVFYALFECLSWAIAAGENIPELGRQTKEPNVRGLRYARNRVHHDWAAAVRYDTTSGEWRWNSEPGLPVPGPRHRDRDGKSCYEEQLAMRPVAETLVTVDRLLQSYPDVPQAR